MNPFGATPVMSAVHPRARGEHKTDSGRRRTRPGSSPRSRGTYNGGKFDFPCGSSPRSRGTFMDRLTKHTFTRFIPALAGNILSDPGRSNEEAVHPRARGEHCIMRQGPEHEFGSSPRSRGTLHYAARAGTRIRFIPALAGNIRTDILFDLHCFGSSPRSRGTLNA